LLFEQPGLSAGLFQPVGHQAQKPGPGAQQSASQSWQQKVLRDALIKSPERQEEEGLAVLSPGGARAWIEEQKWGRDEEQGLSS